jgi:hypothetical protein
MISTSQAGWVLVVSAALALALGFGFLSDLMKRSDTVTSLEKVLKIFLILHHA